METLTATQIKQNLGSALSLVNNGPIQITKRNKVKAYVVSPDDYKAMLKAERLEDKFLEKLAIEARKEGYLDKDDSKNLLDRMLGA